MSLSSAVYITGVGNCAFAAKFVETFLRTAPRRTKLYYMQDITSGCNFDALTDIFWDQFDFLLHAGRGGCNALWADCVKHALVHGYDVAIVGNDDIMFPRSGWVEALTQIFERNDHIGMAGIGSDGVWDQEHKARERWFTDPSLLREAAAHCEDFRSNPVKYVHHVSGPLWATRPDLWLKAGGIPEACFWGWGEIVPCIELRKLGYQSASCQWSTILHYGGGAYHDIHSDRERHESFVERAKQLGDEGQFIKARYGTGHAHLMAEQFDAQLPAMGLPDIRFDPSRLPS